MKNTRTFAALLVLVLLGGASLTLLTSAWGSEPGRGPMSHAWAGPGRGGDMPRCDRGRPGPGGAMHHGPGPQGPGRLAEMLSAVETEIGIRANQLDAWRNFTDALLATMKPPSPPWQAAAGTSSSDDANQPLSLAEHLADNAIARGQSGEALKKAVEALRTTLTPEQLDKVKAIEARFRSWHHGPGHRFGPPPSGPGPQHDDESGPADEPEAGPNDN
jgi:LTXXQ motif family protein